MRTVAAAFAPLSYNQGVTLLRGLITEANGWPMCGAIPTDTVRNILGRIDAPNFHQVRRVLHEFDNTFTERGGYITDHQVERFALQPVLAAA